LIILIRERERESEREREITLESEEFKIIPRDIIMSKSLSGELY
jgi:hypothetical protein